MFSKFGSLSGSCGSGRADRHGSGAPTPRPSYFQDVARKLRSVERLQSLSGKEIEGMVEELTQEELLWSVYFSGVVLDPARDVIEKQLDSEEVEGDEESRSVNGRPHGTGVSVKWQCRRVRGGSQYGVQSFTSLLLKHYGPIHASIVVGRAVVLEWETSGLVIPTGKPLPVVASVSVHSASRSMASKVTLDSEGSVACPEQTATPEEEILHEFETALARKELADNLIEVIVRYNRTYLYHPVLRNCQKFVADCLVALGRPVNPKLMGELGDYIKEVKKGRKRRVDFESHADLDLYVGGALESPKTSPLEMEYLLAQYFMLHVTSMTNCETPDRWMCEVKGCLMPRLERSVDLKNTVAYHMFVPEQ